MYDIMDGNKLPEHSALSNVVHRGPCTKPLDIRQRAGSESTHDTQGQSSGSSGNTNGRIGGDFALMDAPTTLPFR